MEFNGAPVLLAPQCRAILDAYPETAVITQAHFKDFEALRDLEVTLSRLTVLVGANGAGKTTVLHGLERLPSIVVSTHSPDLVDACEPEGIRVLNRDAKGFVRVGELCKHPEAAKWLKLIRPGEFWSTVGEDWVAGQ